MKPKTPLPWPRLPGTQYEIELEDEDYDYTLHAVNAYPKLVEFARYALRASDIKGSATRLLDELGEL